MESIVSYPDRGQYGRNSYRGNCSGLSFLRSSGESMFLSRLTIGCSSWAFCILSSFVVQTANVPN